MIRLDRSSGAASTNRVLTPLLMLLAIAASPVGAEVIVGKNALLDGVNRNGNIIGGGVAQTWASIEAGTVQSTHLVDKVGNDKIEVTYSHSNSPAPTARAVVMDGGNPFGFPISTTGKKVQDNWNPAQPALAIDDHKIRNEARVLPTAFFFPGATTITTWDAALSQRVRRTLTDLLSVGISARVKAGEIQDGDKGHSADAFGAVTAGAARVFVQTSADNELLWKAAQRMTIVGGSFAVPGEKHNQLVLDPYYLSVLDQTTNRIIGTQLLMDQSLNAKGALFNIEDSGIRFTINRADPDSFVSWQFSSDSPWTTAPYSYGVRLDNAGLTVTGNRYPLSDWTVTTTTSTIEAFLPFGVDGLTYDFADVRVPGSLLPVGDTIEVSAESDSGAWETTSIPEAPSLILLSAAAALLSFMIRSRHRVNCSVNPSGGKVLPCPGGVRNLPESGVHEIAQSHDLELKPNCEDPWWFDRTRIQDR